MREAAAEDPRLVEVELGGELTDLLLVVVDQIAARFRVHAAEAVAQSPYATADAVARLDDDDTAAASLELARGGEPREPGANDQYGWSRMALRPVIADLRDRPTLGDAQSAYARRGESVVQSRKLQGGHVVFLLRLNH